MYTWYMAVFLDSCAWLQNLGATSIFSSANSTFQMFASKLQNLVELRSNPKITWRQCSYVPKPWVTDHQFVYLHVNIICRHAFLFQKISVGLNAYYFFILKPNIIDTLFEAILSEYFCLLYFSALPTGRCYFRSKFGSYDISVLF